MIVSCKCVIVLYLAIWHAMKLERQVGLWLCRDAVLITIINCVTSILAGFVIFFVLGYMAQLYGVPLDQVVDKGPELAFIAYPQGLSEMPGASFWSICFFVMLFTLGLDSQVSYYVSHNVC